MMTKSDQPNLVAACGLYCGACYHYRSGFPEGEHLLTEAERRGRRREGYTCGGCHSAQHYVHPGCAHCAIRTCAEEKGLAHCGLCPAFPCGRLRAFQNDGRVHHRDILINLRALNVRGEAAWQQAQAQRWTCDCGYAFSWYEEVCPQCGAALPSYGPDPTIE